MWLITQHGFYSLVRDRENASRFIVRSRSLKDMENLKHLAGIDAEVRSTPEREYPYRMLVEEREMPRVMNSLANTIDYPNFSSRIATRIDQACRSLLYAEVFASLRRIFDPAARKTGRPALGGAVLEYPPVRGARTASAREASVASELLPFRNLRDLHPEPAATQRLRRAG